MVYKYINTCNTLFRDIKYTLNLQTPQAANVGGKIRLGHSILASVTQIIGVTVRHIAGDCLSSQRAPNNRVARVINQFYTRPPLKLNLIFIYHNFRPTTVITRSLHVTGLPKACGMIN